METEKKLLKWFWSWQDEAEEAWLRGMARQGWHLKSVGFPSLYTFTSGEQRDEVYRLDYLKEQRDLANYLQLVQDAGWAYVDQYNNWLYFHKTHQPGTTSEIFTDTPSKILKYRRIMAGMLVFQPIFFLVIIFARSQSPIYPLLQMIGLLTIIYIGINIIMLYRRINQLKQQ